MAVWDDAETTFLNAAAKVYAALKIAHPSGNYGSNIWVTLNIDGVSYRCQVDCTGVIQTIIQYMGYIPNFPAVNGSFGRGLREATAPFVKNPDGTISDDWEFTVFNASDARPGDIRVAGAPHQHADIFVDYNNNHNAYGLNAGSGPNTGGRAIPLSCDAATRYLENGNPEELAATWTIQDDSAVRVLRFVKGRGQSPGSTNSGSVSSVASRRTQSLKSLDIKLGFIPHVEFFYQMMDSTGELSNRVPGFFSPTACYPNNDGIPATDSYGDAWLEVLATYLISYSEQKDEWKQIYQDGLILLYTLDNSDPLLYGRTVLLNEDGTNNYEASRDLVPIIRTQTPLHFRCVLTDLPTHTKDLARSSAYITTESAIDPILGTAGIVKAGKYSMFLEDASGNVPDVSDDHGYLFLNDEDERYPASEYTSWVTGLEE